MIENGPGSSYDVDISLVVVISICYCVASLYLHKMREEHGYAPPIHESCIASLLGLIIGVISRFILQSSTIKFNQDIFFYLILPPIVFSAGYGLKKKKFFRFFHFITLFGIVGTVINFAIISTSTYYFPYFFPSAGVNLTWIESMLLASVVSANDEISALSLIKIKTYPRLGGLIFGEGVINDALSIVLFKTLYSIYFSTNDSPEMKENTSLLSISYAVFNQLLNSCLIGVFCGLINARFLKVFSFSRKHPIHQTSLVLLTGYLAYCIAEASGTSGILTLFVCAVTLSHYSWHSLSKSAQLSTKIMFVSLSDLAEGISFAYVGLSLWNYSSGDFSFTFSCYLLLVIIGSRFFTIITICRFTNYLYGDSRSKLSTTIDGYRSIESADDEEVLLETPHKKNKAITTTNSKSENLIPFNEQIAFTLGGIVRGCLCWAQILQLHDSLPILMTATLFVIFVTTNGCGILLPIIIPRLLSEDSNKITVTKVEKVHQSSDHPSKAFSYQTPGNDEDISMLSTYSMHVDHSEDGDSRNLDDDASNAAYFLSRQDGQYDVLEDDEEDDVYSDTESVFEDDADDAEKVSNLVLRGAGEEDKLELFQRDFIQNSSDLSHGSRSSQPHNRETDLASSKLTSNPSYMSPNSNINSNYVKLQSASTKSAKMKGLKTGSNAQNSINRSGKQMKGPQSTSSSSVGNTRSYTHLFVCWVRIDELFLKPLFGGSKTGQTKSKLIELTNDVHVMSLLSPTKKINIVNSSVSKAGISQLR